MHEVYINSLKISQASLIEIYNTVPRTLSQSAIVVSVNQDLSFKQETSGNFWIIKIDISTGWLFPKRGQVFDKYQYSSLQNLFKCSGYEQQKNKEFIIQKPAQVSFNTDKKQWHLKTPGILEFGDNSPLTRLKKALEERERLLTESEQDKLEIKNLHNKIQESQTIASQLKSEIEELKINHAKLLDSFTELQRDKKYQQEINNNLLKINNKLSSIEQNNLDKKYSQEFKASDSSTSNIVDKVDKTISKTLNLENDQESHKKTEKNLKKFSNIISNNLTKLNQSLTSIDSTSEDKIDKEEKQDSPSINSPIIPKKSSSISHTDLETNFDITSKHSPENLEELENLVAKYNTKTLEYNVLSKVAVTIESLEKVRTGIKTPILLSEDSNDNYWILSEFRTPEYNYYLVPKYNLIINDRIYQTVENIFVCEGYENRVSNKFQLIHPAEVVFIGNQWKLLNPGKLRFEVN